MPLELKPPREGKSPNYTVRGTYLKVYVDQSTGTGELRVAKQVLAKIKGEIERGEFGKPVGPTFADAAMKYMESGRSNRFLTPLLNHFKERALSSIDQNAIDEAAIALYPNGDNATRNRQVYTPVSAILKRAGIKIPLQRPKGALGQTRTDWLWPEQAFRLFKEADKIDPEFGLFLRFLTYTGLRLSEALNLEWRNVDLDTSFAYIPDTKSGDPRPVFLPPTALHNRLASLKRKGPRVFRLSKSGYLYNLLKEAKEAAGLPNVNFHTLRHTWATWMRRFGGLDTKGLMATGAWKSRDAASRYEHVLFSEEAKKAALLPTEEDE